MARRAPASLYARVLRVGAWWRRPARSARPLGPPTRPAHSARPLGVRAASCLLGVCAASRPLGPPACRPLRELPARRPRRELPAQRVFLKPAPRAACSPSAELVFSCLFACWCLVAAARPLAVRAASFARRVVSKPGQALPPPPGTIAKPCGSFGVLHSGSSVFCLLLMGAVHPISRHCTLSDRVQCSLTGARLLALFRSGADRA